MNNQIDNLILNPAELDKQKIQQVINNLNHKNVDYSDLYFQYSKNEFFAIEDGAVKNASFCSNTLNRVHCRLIDRKQYLLIPNQHFPDGPNRHAPTYLEIHPLFDFHQT